MRVLSVLLWLGCLFSGWHLANAQSLHEPMIQLSGAQLQALHHFPPASIAAFRFTTSHTWEQIPVQIDERVSKNTDALWNKTTTDSTAIQLEVYADPFTYTGSDLDDLIDENDELLVRWSDAGIQANLQSLPPGVACAPLEVEIYDPLQETYRYVYLFVHHYQLAPDAGTDLVDYSFQLLAGSDFREVYQTSGNNPENSWVSTSHYRWHFSDDWINDAWYYEKGSNPQQDFIDFARLQLGPGLCNRHIGTFSEGSGTHIASTNGPLRAIRSVMGANSGHLLQRTYWFYEYWVEIQTDWRVHPVRGLFENIDWNSNLQDMTYYNAHHLDGLPVNGQPDQIDTTFSPWQLISGPLGSVWIFTDYQATFELWSLRQYFLDEWNSSIDQCVGDDHAFGQCGYFIEQQIPNTDPRQSDCYQLNYRQYLFFLPPHQTPQDTEVLLDRLQQPFLVKVQGELDCGHQQTFFRITPNPVDQHCLYLQIAPAQTAQLRIFDSTGQLAFQTTVHGNGPLTLPPQLAAGIYWLEIANQQFRQSKKLIIL